MLKTKLKTVLLSSLLLGLGFGPNGVALAKKQPSKTPVTRESTPAAAEIEVEAEEKDAGPTDPVQQFDLAMKALAAGNSAEALQWLEKSAVQGYSAAQFRLGQMHESGTGVSKNPAEAVKWYLKSAKQGSALAQYSLGQLYEQAGNQKESVYWLVQAAHQSSTPAQFALARHYEAGTGVKKSLQEAYKYLVLAASDGAPTHVYNRDRVAGLLTPAEVESIQNLLNQWKSARASAKAPQK